MFRSSPPDSSKDETPKSPLSISSSSSPPQKPQPGPGPQFKNRIQSWMKDAEEDAEKAEQYLDKKREKKAAPTKDIVDKTDVMKTMEAIEKESSSKRKKTPPGAASETERKKQLIRALGRKPSEERVSVYVRKSSVDHTAAASPKNSPTEPENKTKQFMDTMAARNRKVSSSSGNGFASI